MAVAMDPTRRLRIAGLAALLALLPLVAGAGEAGSEAPGPAAAVDLPLESVQLGAVVHLRFTLRSQAGEVLDGNAGRSPLVFTVGAGEVIQGLERGLMGMTTGETRRITVEPADAYGAWDPAAVSEVPRDRLPTDAREVGARVRARTQSGREVWARVREVGEATALLDLNHPLAGQTLVFDVEIVLVEPP
jgi:FKBP-type peptidyl-prolyl cis-trans isomerase 2